MGGSSTIIVDPATVERLAWTLLHSLWEGALVALVLAIAMSAMARRSAAARYAALCAGLAAMLAAPVITFWLLRGAFDDPGPLLVATASTPLASRPQLTPYARVAMAVRPWTGYLLTAWLACTLALSARQAVAWLLLQRLLLRDTLPLEERWLTAVAHKLRLDGVRFLESRTLDVPATVGWLRPVVLLPAAALTGLTLEHLEAIVAHELAHVRRRDYLVNLMHTAAETLLFYHPAVWWISRRIREERENCCDDIAAAVTGGGRAFAEALLALEDRRASMPLAMAATGGTLWKRIARLVGAPRPHSSRTGPLAVACIIAVLASAAGHVLSGAVIVRPDRQLDDVKSLCGATYEILGVHPASDGFVTELASAVERMKNHQLSDESLDALGDALNRSAPDELAGLVLPRVHLNGLFTHQESPNWRHGTLEQRTRISQAMWNRARAIYPADPQWAMQLARAALLLSAQDSFMFGVAQMRWLLESPDFAHVAQLTQRQHARLRRHVADHRTITAACVPPLLDAQRAATASARSSTDRAATLRMVRDKLLAALRVAPDRYDVQWRVASISATCFREAGHAPLAGADLSTPDQTHLNRWLAQAVKPMPTDRHSAQRVTLEQFRRIRRER